MSNDVLKANKRTATGSNAVKQLRNNHFIPGVLYGHHIDSVSIQVQDKAFEKFYKLHGTGASLHLDIDGEKTFVLFKDLQIEPLKNETIHIEFQALSAGEKIKVKVPIRYVGSESIPAGIVFQKLHHQVEMSVLPKDIIEEIVIDVSEAKLGDQKALKEIDAFTNEAYDISEHPDTLLYTLTEPALHVETEETDTPVTAEVPLVGESTEE